jgi:transposase
MQQRATSYAPELTSIMEVIPMNGKAENKRGRRSRRAKSKRRLEVCNPEAAGIDIGAREHWVAVGDHACEQPVRCFESFTSALHALADWLTECGVRTVAMESTGVYWVPLYEILEERNFEVLLVNAKHVRNVPGRKSDVLDCQWLQQLHTFGLLRASFRPAAEIVELRSYVRHREMLVRAANSHVQHMHKALTLMNVQIHHVISDITGETGMRIVRAIVAGTHDPQALAEHRDYRCRASKERIAASLEGNYRPEHVFALQQALALYDSYMGCLRACEARIEHVLTALAQASSPPQQALPEPKQRQRPHGKQPHIDIREPLYRITGADLTQIDAIAPLTALNIIAEIGTDMNRWPTEKNFASWLNLAPGSHITGGRRIHSRRPPVNNRLADLLRLAAVTLGRTQTALGAFYRRMAARLDKPKAVVATAHKLARLIYRILKHGLRYNDPGTATYDNAQRARAVRNLRKRAKALGFSLLEPEPTGAVT